MKRRFNNGQMKLKTREDFPHEIGLLLGYPLADVKAFIENEGKLYCMW